MRYHRTVILKLRFHHVPKCCRCSIYPCIFININYKRMFVFCCHCSVWWLWVRRPSTLRSMSSWTRPRPTSSQTVCRPSLSSESPASVSRDGNYLLPENTAVQLLVFSQEISSYKRVGLVFIKKRKVKYSWLIEELCAVFFTSPHIHKILAEILFTMTFI